MSVTMRPIPASMSFAGYAYQNVTDWLNDNDSQVEKGFKQISAEIAYAGILILGAVEVLARGVHLLALKGFSYYVEAPKKRAFTKKYIMPLAENFLFCTAVVGGTAMSLKDNFSKYSQREGQVIDGNDTIDKASQFIIKKFHKELKAMGFPVPDPVP